MSINILTKIFFLFSLFGINFTTKSQPYKTEKEFKTYLLENNDKLNFIEGIWEFNKNIKSGFKDKKNKNIEFPSYNISIAPYKVAIIKASENNFFCYKVDILDKITEIDACDSYWFKSTAMESQYIYDVGTSCKYSYHNKAIIKANGDLYFDGKFEEYKDDIFSWDNFTVIATKLSPTPSEIKNYKVQSGTDIDNKKH